MPKVVDHVKRRREIAAAALRVVARGGVQAADMRSVAAEAGWSAGAIAHYFPDKHTLLMGTLQEAAEIVTARMTAVRETASGPDLVVGLLEAGLPLNDEQAATCRVFYHFAAQGLSEPVFVAEIASYYAFWRSAVALALKDCPGIGGRPVPELDREALRLVSLVEGLAIQAIFSPVAFPAEDQRALVRTSVERLLTGPRAKGK